MKHKGFYVLAIAAILGVAAGCGKDVADDALEGYCSVISQIQ